VTRLRAGPSVAHAARISPTVDRKLMVADAQDRLARDECEAEEAEKQRSKTSHHQLAFT
jgi:hypothetical protein